jgi:hypothetical protein
MPGMGWCGSAPPDEFKIDDEDELTLFWNSDVALFLHPEHPSFQPRDVNSRSVFPLDESTALWTPNLKLLVPHDRHTLTSTMNVLHVPFFSMKMKNNEDIVVKREIDRMFRMIQIFFGTHAHTDIRRSISSLIVLLISTDQRSIDETGTQVILSMGRWMRNKLIPIMVTLSLAQHVLPLIK